MKGAPCKDCEERHFSCHSHCVKYIDFRKALDDYNSAVAKEKEKESRYIPTKSIKKGRY